MTENTGRTGRRRRTLPRMVRDLVNDAGAMLRQEIRLLRLEVSEIVREIARRSGQMAVGGSIVVGGLLALGAFVIVGGGMVLGERYWLSALLTGILLLAGGAAMIFLGARNVGRSLNPPKETIASLKRTGEWVGEELEDLRAGVLQTSERSLPMGTPLRIVDEGSRAAPLPVVVDSAELRRMDRAGASAGVHSVSRSASAAPAQEQNDDDANDGGKLALLRRLGAEIAADDVMGNAAKIAYYMFLSLPPAILVLFGLTGMFGGEGVANLIMEQAQRALPGSIDDPDSAAALVASFVEQVVHENAPGPLSIGLVLGLWSSSAVFAAITDSLNVAYGIEESRPWVKKRLLAVGVMLAFLLLFLSGSALIIAGPHITSFLPFDDVVRTVLNIVQWPAAAALVVAAFFLVYYVLPNRDQRASKRILLGSAAIATGLWLIGTSGFRVYVANFASYSESYGFIGAILVLLLWMYLTGIIILVGGEIGSELEHRSG